MTSVLVTGVSGFLGRYIARYFKEQGISVIGTDSGPQENAPLEYLEKYQRLQLPHPEFNSLLESYKPDFCIHCAGRASVALSMQDPEADFQASPMLTFSLLNSLRQYAPSCGFIFLSSAAVYGDPNSLPIEEDQKVFPVSPYGYHKFLCENLCQEFSKIYGIRSASLRIFSAYGPGLRRQVLWDIARKAMLQKELFLRGTGSESRDFIHALDIAKAVHLVTQKAPMQGEAYNLATGRETSIRELANLIIHYLDDQPSLVFDGTASPGDPLRWQANIDKLKNLGFTPEITLERGVKTFVHWCQAELKGVW
jgi:UDP-glucose 4-epimerase